MSISLTTHNTTEIATTVVRDHFLVELAFSTPIRLSSRDTVTFDSNSYQGVMMSLSLNLDGRGGRISFLDENFTHISSFISERSGITAKVWALYGSPTDWTSGDENILYEGEIGRPTMKDATISFPLVAPQSKYICDVLINEQNGFNHLPPAGTKFQTANGIIVLEKLNG